MQAAEINFLLLGAGFGSIDNELNKNISGELNTI
jgi:hypothetical protein